MSIKAKQALILAIGLALMDGWLAMLLVGGVLSNKMSLTGVEFGACVCIWFGLGSIACFIYAFTRPPEPKS